MGTRGDRGYGSAKVGFYYSFYINVTPLLKMS